MFWRAVTRLGESGIVLPLVLVVAIGLGWSARRADRALSSLLPIALAATLVTATKIAFMGFGWGIARLDFTGMSGHAMLAAAIYPVLVVVFVPPTRPAGARRWRRGSGHRARGRLARRDQRPFRIGGAQRLRRRRARGGGRDPVHRRAGGIRVSLAWLAPALAWMLLTLPAPPVMPSHNWITKLALTLSGRDHPYVRADLHR